MNKLQQAFSSVKASDQLKQNTLTYVQEERIIRKYKAKGRKFRYIRYVAALAALLLVVGLGSHLFLSQAVSYIDVDGLPSIGLALNRLNRVVSVRSFNEEGALVSQRQLLKGKSYIAAIDSLLSDTAYASPLTDSPEVTFSIVSSNTPALLHGIESCEGYAEYNGNCATYDHDILDQAHDCGLSLGKYQAYLTLCDYKDEITPSECRNLSMEELNQRISHHASGNHNETDHANGDHDTASHEPESHRSTIRPSVTAKPVSPPPKPTATASPSAPVSTPVQHESSHNYDSGYHEDSHSYDSDHYSNSYSYDSGYCDDSYSYGSDYCDDSYSYNSSYCDDSYSYNSGYCDDSYSYNSGYCDDYSDQESHHGSSHDGGHH